MIVDRVSQTERSQDAAATALEVHGALPESWPALAAWHEWWWTTIKRVIIRRTGDIFEGAE